jgi:hypothetical protein
MEQRGYCGLALARLLSHAFKATCATEACVRRSLASNPQPTERSPLTHGVTARHPQARSGVAEIRKSAVTTGSAKKIRSIMSFPSWRSAICSEQRCCKKSGYKNVSARIIIISKQKINQNRTPPGSCDSGLSDSRRVGLSSLLDRIRGNGPAKEKAVQDAKVRSARLAADLVTRRLRRGRSRRSRG